MEIKILHSIIHKELMPWGSDLPPNKLLAENIRKAGTKQPTNTKELVLQLKSLLSNYAELVAWLDKKQQTSDEAFVQLYCSISLPSFVDTVTKFYSLVISKECLRIFNVFLTRSKKWNNSIDINYHTNILLKNIKTLTSQTIKEIKERGIEDTDDSANHIPFVLKHLELSLLSLYFSVQEITKNSLEQTITLDDLYVLDLNQPVSALPVLVYHNESENGPGEYKGKQEKLSFGFKGEVAKLNTVISQLCFKLQFLNEDVSKVDELMKLLTSKNIHPGSTKIQLGCETRIFRYIIDKLQPYFKELTFANIEKSALFFSKKDTPITANNLSASNKSGEPKEKETIDKIINNLQ